MTDHASVTDRTGATGDAAVTGDAGVIGDAGGPRAAGARDVARAATVDARLLVPALVAWAAVASLLAEPPGLVLGVAASLVALAVVLLWDPLRRAPAALLCRMPGRRMGPHRSPGGRVDNRRDTRGRGAACTGVALCAVASGLCLLATAANAEVRDAGLVPTLAAQRATAAIEAVVTSDPRVVAQQGVRRSELVVVQVSVRLVVGRGLRSETSTPVLVFGDPRWAGLHWHDTIRASGRFSAAQPGDDVVAVLNPVGAPTRLAGPGPLFDAAERVRAGLRAAVAGLPADARGLLPGLVIGDTSQTPQSLTDAMRRTGLTHLAAVSGSNVAVVLAAALALCRVVGVRRRWRPVVALVLLAGFVVLARPEPSVLRAAAMGVVGLVGLSASRARAGIPALSAAVVVLLVLDPWLARSFGFALSTLATLGLLLFAGPWGRWIARYLPARAKGLGPAIAIPVAAQAMCGPVVVLLQGSVTLVGVVANLLAAPLVAPATVLGVGVALVAPVARPVAGVLAWAAGVPTLGIAWVARACAQVPMGSVPWPQGAGGAVLLAAVTVVVILLAPFAAAVTRQRPYAVACLAVVALAAAWPVRGWSWPPPHWRLVACDVGQGDGLVLATEPGHAVVVDTGPDPALEDGCLTRLRVTVVDAVILTHFHADHVDGLPGVLHGRTVRQILTSPVRDPPAQASAVDRWAAAVGVPVHPLYAGDAVSWGPFTAHVLWPLRVIHEGSVPNNASIVMTVDDGGLRVLMLGDVETPAAHQVLLALRRLPAWPSFDVVKVAHHGSALQDPALVGAVRSPVAIISVGAGNSYGHPAPTTITLLRADGFAVFRTDQRGDVAVTRSDDGRPLVTTRGP